MYQPSLNLKLNTTSTELLNPFASHLCISLRWHTRPQTSETVFADHAVSHFAYKCESVSITQQQMSVWNALRIRLCDLSTEYICHISTLLSKLGIKFASVSEIGILINEFRDYLIFFIVLLYQDIHFVIRPIWWDTTNTHRTSVSSQILCCYFITYSLCTIHQLHYTLLLSDLPVGPLSLLWGTLRPLIIQFSSTVHFIFCLFPIHHFISVKVEKNLSIERSLAAEIEV